MAHQLQKWRNKMDWTQLSVVLAWLVGAGSPAVITYLFSWVSTNLEFWKNLPGVVKFALPLVLSILLSIGAAQLLKFPDILSAIQPWYQIVVAAVLAYLASQKGEMTAKKDALFVEAQKADIAVKKEQYRSIIASQERG